MAILAKVSTKLWQIETQDEQLRVSAIFAAYKAAHFSSTPESEYLDELFLQLERLEKVFAMSRIDDGFKFNQELQELTADFNQFFI